MDDQRQTLEPTGTTGRARAVVLAAVAAVAGLVLVASAPVGAATVSAWGVPGDVGQPAALAFRLTPPAGVRYVPGAIAMPDRIMRESNKYRSSRQKLCVLYAVEAWDDELFGHSSDYGVGIDWHVQTTTGSCVWISAKANRAVLPGTWFADLIWHTSYRVRVAYAWYLPNGRQIGYRSALLDSAADYQCNTTNCLFGPNPESQWEGDPGGLHFT